MKNRPHLIDGEFQSDKYPTTPRGKVPLSVKDVTAQDLLWEYAQRRRTVDKEFADDLEEALRIAGYIEAKAKCLGFYGNDGCGWSGRESELHVASRSCPVCHGGHILVTE
jgi:hypothetical protein